MKRKLFLVVGIFLLASTIGLKSQNCNLYFPSREGAVSEMASYNAKDKLEGTTKTVIIKKETGADGITIQFESVYKDKSGDEKNKGHYKVRCQNGIFYFNMDNMMPQNGADPSSMEVKADEMEFPANPQIGQTLKDAKITMTMNAGMMKMEMSVAITNRKVETFEEMTTPAGKFNCYKLTYKVKTHMMADVETSVTQWIAQDIGVIKTENYDKNGKKVAYSVLTVFNP